MSDDTQTKPAVFLDRDGTLIEEVNYLSRVEDLRIFDYTAEAIDLLKKSGFLIIVVTNQSGIGRNIFGEAEMHAIHEKLQSELTDSIDGFYFCPHLPCDGCRCRKPAIGMIEAAGSDFALNLPDSWIIGDKKIDVETGFNAGIKTAMVKTGYGRRHAGKLEKPPDIIAENLLEAVKFLLA